MLAKHYPSGRSLSNRRHRKHLLVGLFQRIDLFLKVDVVGRKLSLWQQIISATIPCCAIMLALRNTYSIICLAQLLLGKLEGP